MSEARFRQIREKGERSRILLVFLHMFAPVSLPLMKLLEILDEKRLRKELKTRVTRFEALRKEAGEHIVEDVAHYRGGDKV